MGKIVLLSDVMPELLPMEDRTPGLHISGIIKDLCIKLGHFKDDGSGLSKAYMRLGNAFEFALIEMLARHEPDRYVQIGELERDGLHGTPDIVDARDHAVEEIKVAWMSANHDVEGPKFWRYWVQLKAYCWMLETRVGRLRVCHVNGAYEWVKTGQPAYRHYEQVFSERELRRNWDMLRKHGERHRERLEEGRTT